MHVLCRKYAFFKYPVGSKKLKKCILCSKELDTDKQLPCFVGCNVGFRTENVGGGQRRFCFHILWRTKGAEMLSKAFIQEGLFQTISRRMPCYMPLHMSA